MHLSVEELIHYTDEERARWERWFHENGAELLAMPIVGDRETTVGALILHIFGPELRYVQRLKEETPTEYRGRPVNRIEEIFGFGMESRKALRAYVRDAKPEEWFRMFEFEIGLRPCRASARKIVLHMLLHEIRHWAQVARIMRERGFEPPGEHDLLFSSALI